MSGQDTEGIWRIDHGAAVDLPEPSTWRNDREDLTYSNPFGQDVERVWFDGRVVFAAELGEVDVDLDRVKVAQEYQVVYEVELDKGGKPLSERNA